MAKPGPKPGSPKTGGRKKGVLNKATQAKRKLLATVEEQFLSADYDPLKEMVDLAQKSRLAVQDQIKFGFHLALAKKYYPDVAAVKVSGDPDAPIAIEYYPSKLQEALNKAEASRNGDSISA